MNVPRISPKTTAVTLPKAAKPSRGKSAATLSGIFLAVLIVVAIAAPWIAPYSPDQQALANRLMTPSPSNWLGTDDYGRDVLSRLIYGARASLSAAGIAVSVALIIGLPLGVLAGYVGGWFNAVVGRIMDALMSTPSLVLALSIVAVLGPGILKAMLAVGIVMAPRVFRVARATTADVRGETHIEAAVSVGAAPLRILIRNILPNVLSPIILVTAVSLGSAIAAEASLSFLGLGVRAPESSWGSMLSTAASNVLVAPHLVWPPGIMIFLSVLAFTYLGDGIRRATSKDRASLGGRP